MPRMLSAKLATALRLGAAERRLVAEAAAALLAARLRSGLVPFSRIARDLGGLVAPGAPDPESAPSPAALSPAEREAVFAVRWAIGAVAPWMPFRSLCLQRALAGRAMLARRGIGSVLHLGVDPSRPRLTAHAWLDAGGLQVTGYPLDATLAEVGRFV